MDEDKIIGTRFGGVGAPPSPDDKRIGVTRDGHDVYERRDGTRYTVYKPGTKTIYTAKYNPNNSNDTDWWNTGNIATDENGRRFYGNTPEEAQQKYEAWKQQWLQTHGAWNTIDMINAMTGGIFNQLSPTQLGRNIYNMATGNPDYARQFVYGNNGLVPDEQAAEHPALAAVINAGADIGVLGGPSLLRATGRLAANTGRAAGRAVKNIPRTVEAIPENMIRVVDKGKQAAEYLKDLYNYNRHVHRINTRGNLYSGIPMPDLAITEQTANKALDNITKALQAGQEVNPFDARIVRKFFNMSDDELAAFIKDQSIVQKSKLLDRLYASQLDLADMEAILADKQLLKELSPETQQALANEFDAALYKSVQTADDQAQAAKSALTRRQTDNYYDELNRIANPPKKPATSPIETRVMPTGKTPEQPPEPGAAASAEGSATQGAPASGAVPLTGSAEATVNKVKPLVEKFIDTYDKLRLYYGKNALGEVEVNRLYNDAGNLIEDAVGAGGTRIPLVKSADQVTTATQMMPQYVNQHLIDRIYPKSLYRVSNNAVDWSPKGIRKWIYKMPENMNTQIRHVGNDLYFYGPKAPLQNLVKTGIGLGAVAGVGVGVPTLLGLGKSLVSDAPEERYVQFLDGSVVPLPQVPFTADSLRARNPQTQIYVPVVRVGKNWQEETKEAAEALDAYNNKIAAEQKTSNAPVDVDEENTDSANINSVINGY